MTEPPEDVIEAVRSIHDCGREEALAIIERDVRAVEAVTVLDPMWRHPRGHPCRDCNRYFDQHRQGDGCGGWR